MKGQAEQEAFAALVKREPKWLDRPMEELVKIQAVGSVYLATHRQLLRKIKSGQITLAEEDRKAKLKEGQAIGEALLDVEAKIGSMVPTPEELNAEGRRRLKGRPRGSTIESPLPESLRGTHRAARARAIHRNPAAVAAVKREAKANDDIPTKTAVLKHIAAEKERKLREKYEREVKGAKIENLAAVRGDALKYLSRLREIVHMLPAKPPESGWTKKSLEEARAMAALITKRLEAFTCDEKATSTRVLSASTR